MSDRVLVMREGRLVAELSRAEATQERSSRRRPGSWRRMIARVRGLKPQELAAAAFRLRELGIVIALGVAVVFFAIRAPNFLTVGNWQDIAKDVAIVVVVAVGETMVVLTRNIDLSVGSIVGLTAYLVAPTARRSQRRAARARRADRDRDRPRLRARQRPARRRSAGSRRSSRRWRRSRSTAASPFEITAGRTGLGLPAARLASSTSPRGSRRRCRCWRGSPSCVAIVGAAVLRWTPWGRDFYAIGSNPDAARFAGIRVGRRVIAAFTLCGALAGLGGFMFASRFPNVDAVRGDGLRARRDHRRRHRRRQRLRRVGHDSRRRPRRSARRDDPERLHAAARLRVLEDVLQRRRDRRRGHDRRTRHAAAPGDAAAAASRRGPRRQHAEAARRAEAAP